MDPKISFINDKNLKRVYTAISNSVKENYNYNINNEFFIEMKGMMEFILQNVPKYGITVGLNTISKLSKKVILVLTGKEKNFSYQKIISLKKYDKNWPVSIIYKCKNQKIYIDQKAQYSDKID